jgi:putative solute:sodium symporter small subunit
MQDDKAKMQAYWKENLTYITILLSIWFVVSYVCGILIANPLDTMSIGGFKLGFWFANQGSEVVFVILIFIYVWLMNKLDRKYDVHEV